MICKLIILCLLAASPALSSSIKGYQQQREEAPLAAVKGYQREEIRVQQKEELAPVKGYQNKDEAGPWKGQQKEETVALVEATKSAPPAKGHLQREEAKGYQRRQEEAPAAVKGNRVQEQQREEIKGERLIAPIEHQQQQQLSKTSLQQQVVKIEDKKVEQKLEDVKQERELQQQQRDESSSLTQQKLTDHPAKKATNYEARPQVLLSTSEIAREGQQPQLQQQEEEPLLATKSNGFKSEHQQQREILHESQQVETIREEQQRFVQHEQQQLWTSNNNEQRRLSDYDLQQQRHDLIQLQQEQLQEQSGAAIKGASPPLVAPPGMAEPYAFEYQVEGSSRKESGDVNGVVRGQYTLQGADGLSRVVDYVADANGFRASVNTNEPGTEAASPAGISLHSNQPAAQDITLRLEGKTREFLNPPAAIKAAPVPPKPDNWQAKGQAPLAAQTQVTVLEESQQLTASKGQKIEQQQLASIKSTKLDTAEQQPLKSTSSESQASIDQTPLAEEAKSAELRAPKSLANDDLLPRSSRPLAGFESATAHRRPIAERRPAVTSLRQTPVQAARASHHQHYVHPAVPVVHPHHGLRTGPIVHHPNPVPLPIRYESPSHHLHTIGSPVISTGHRRPNPISIHPEQPRFYASNDDESLTASFERSS